MRRWLSSERRFALPPHLLISSSPHAREARWLEVAVEADAETAEELMGVLRRFCPDGVVAVQELVMADDDAGWDGAAPAGPVTVRGYLLVDAQTEAARRRLEEAVWHVSAIAPGSVSGPTFQVVREEDWANAWKRYYRPQRVGRILLVPTWLEAPVEPEDVVLRLDPGAAFGTGLHPSTRLALQLLEGTPLAGRRLLDVGTGSGILAIAGALLGAREVLAVDTSAVAAAVARENARVNGQEGRITVLDSSVAAAQAASAEPFDVVVANIVAKVLTQLAPELAAAMAPGGDLLLSGIIEPAELELLIVFATLGFLPLERLAEGDWRALRLRRER